MLHVHRAERADGLVERLAALLDQASGDPMAPEVVSVPTRGVERWLGQRLSGVLGAGAGRADGVCANVDFPFPGRLLGRALASAAGVERDEDPWLAERSVWPLLEVVDASLGQPWLAALAAHVGAGVGAGAQPDGGDGRSGRRFGAVRHVADLFDRYAVHRPGMLRAWQEGRDVDGSGRPLPAGGRWQAELWRLLRQRIGVPGPAERLRAACALLRAEPERSDLPGRISLFGLTRLPASYLEVLSALAAARDVHLLLLHPSPALWEEVATTIANRGPRSDPPLPALRAEGPTATLARNALLSSWGRDAREMQLVLAGAGQATDEHRAMPTPAVPTLLGRLQADVAADRPAPGPPLPGQPDERELLAPEDRSLRVHSCHGRARQVEVVRDAVLHLLADDPTLEPRDAIVMCPDIEAYAPLVHAVFGSGEEVDEAAVDPPASGPADLRVRLADRSLRQTNAVLGVVSHLLELAAARVTASQVLDLAAREPVRRRFGLDDDQIARIEEWVRASGVRWGLDAEGRRPYRLASLDQGTWHAGLDRMLVGVTMADQDARLVGGVLPLDDVESGAIDLVGRLAELIQRLGAALAGLRGPQPVADWARSIAAGADALTACGDEEVWQRAQLDRILDEVRREAGPEGRPSATPLELAEVRALLADRLAGRPTRANFRTGHLTVCTLVPMRSVPHRVVCLMGLDDGVFPRRRERDGDDLTLEEPHVGDTDGRGEDRQLLLDALMAATEHLLVTYAGRDERTNAQRPPAVPVGELLDQVDRTARTELTGPDGQAVPARELVLVRHPLQPFDGRNFSDGAIEPGRRWSFDPVACDGARAMAGGRSQTPPFLSGRLPSAAAADTVELDALVAFVGHPVRAFLRSRLGITLAERDEEPSDALSVELEPLEQWAAGDRLLAARLAGVGRARALDAERARGLLPPGLLADRTLDSVAETVEQLAAGAEHLTRDGGDPRTVEIDVRLSQGPRLVGSVDGVRGDRLVELTFSRIAPGQRLRAWTRMLALAVALPDRPVEAVTIGRRRLDALKRYSITISHIGPLHPGEARRQLALLVDLYLSGMREPLPLYVATSAAWAQAVASGRTAAKVAEKAWRSDFTIGREDKQSEHGLVLGGQRPFAEILGVPTDDERGPGWAMDETTRLGRLARRLWDGLLAAERLEDVS